MVLTVLVGVAFLPAGVAFGWGNEGENTAVVLQHQPDVSACVACHPATGYGDSPHGGFTNNTNRCRICHWAHNAPLGGADLLPGPTVSEACKTCHDGTGGAGVYGVLTRRGWVTGSAHRVYGASINVIPGGSASTGGSVTQVFGGEGGFLSCDDCHSPHANNIVAAFVKPRLRSNSPESVLNTYQTTTALLRQRPTGSDTTVTAYGSDWCATCHKGRHSGGSVVNHPVDSKLEWPGGGQFVYDSVALAFEQYALGIAVSGANVYVSDPGNMRLQRFSTAGAYLGQTSFTGDWSQPLSPTGLAANGTGEVWVALPRWTRDGYLQYGVINRVDTNLNYLGQILEPLDIPNAIAFNAAGDAIYSDISPSQYDTLAVLFAGGGKATWEGIMGSVDTACGIAVDAGGNIYVANTNKNEIRKYDSSRTLITTWGSAGAGNGQFNRPMGIAVDSANNVYVADSGNNRIQKFSAAGAYLGQWGVYGTSAGQFAAPGGIAVDASNNVYVVDPGNDRVQKFTSAGVFLTQFGGTGSGNGQFVFKKTNMGTMALSNGGYVMPVPRTAEQAGHYPICQQCHSDQRSVGFLSNGYAATSHWRTGLDGTIYNTGITGFGNPTVQVFPHEAINDNLLVENSDDLCTNCHDAQLLP